ncbi:hypothetical protein GGS21DRAFT_400397 [Xylaria nigripes]|nr:hypothetical protein GGS21DRAFT_400397 [Xylaria nigripes]
MMNDDFDPSISNGSCWANVNVALEKDYIPCGNAGKGSSFACCHNGDICLSSHACFHIHYGITYLAGCTTQDFSGPACQNKGDFFNQSWVGLTRCDPDKVSWAGCPEKKGIVGSDPPTPNCKCSNDTILFRDSPILDNIASLPSRLGGSISWYPGYEPTLTTSSASTQTTDSSTFPTASNDPVTTDPSSSTSTIPTSTIPTPTTLPEKGLSGSQKAGIGAGTAAGAIAIGCLIAVLLQRWKTKKQAMRIAQQPLSPFNPDPLQVQPTLPNVTVLGSYKAELPAQHSREPSVNIMTSSLPRSSTQVSAASTATTATNRRQYIPYRPGVYGPDSRYSNISQLSNPNQAPPAQDYVVSPVSAFSAQFPEEPRHEAGGQSRPKTEHPDTIHELE